MYPVIASATLNSGGTAVTYSDPKVLSELAKCDITENYVDGKYDADNTKVLYKQRFVDADINVEVESITMQDQSQLFGHTISTSGTETTVSEMAKKGSDVIPQIAFGFIHNEALRDGTEKWVAHFFPWAQAKPSTLSYATANSDGITFNGHGLQLKAYDDPINLTHELVEEFTTEAAAKAYLNGKISLT